MQTALQWLNSLRRRYPEAQAAFDTLRLVHDPAAIDAWMVRATGAANAVEAPSAELGQPC